MDFTQLSGLTDRLKSLFGGANPASSFMSPEMEKARLAGAMPGELAATGAPTPSTSEPNKLGLAGQLLQQAGRGQVAPQQQQQSSAFRPGQYDLDPALRFMLQQNNIGQR